MREKERDKHREWGWGRAKWGNMRRTDNSLPEKLNRPRSSSENWWGVEGNPLDCDPSLYTDCSIC